MQEGLQNAARVSVVRFLVAFRVAHQARGKGCNVLDGECAPRSPCAVALALGLIDRAALLCSIIYYQNMAAWCGMRSTTSVGTHAA